jgi:putative nucleotidyltransferase with HDIG domain
MSLLSSRGVLSLTRVDPSFAMIAAFTRVMSARDHALYEHGQRVQRYAVALADEAAITDDRVLVGIDAAALLHDIGKLGIPDAVLRKPGPLTPEEYDQVRDHVLIGADLLAAVPFPGPLALIVRHHHEKWDGSGYPDGLHGEAIPIGSRVLAIADCYDALTSERPYRRGVSHDCAVAKIYERRGTMYDPKIAEAFLRIFDRARSAREWEGAGRRQARAQALWQLARTV